MLTFSPTRNPSWPGTARQIQPRMNVSEFGDGYTQRTADGLNAKPQTFEVPWQELPIDLADEIEAFFESLAVGEAFLWTPPDEASPRKFVVTAGPHRTYATPTSRGLQVSLREVFDL